MGLTVSQFDVIATLGNTQGMSCREIGEKTLMVKGTLTGVLDRLEKKGLLNRQEHPEDKRSFLISLTPKGQNLFGAVFPAHLRHLETAFDPLGEKGLLELERQLKTLRRALETPPQD